MLAATIAICETLELIRKQKKKSLSCPNENIRPNSASVAVDSAMETELARDSSRQEANLTLTQDSLTTTQDSVVPDEVVIASQEDTFHWSQPSFDQVISRWYKLSAPTWSYTNSQDTSILTMDVSKALFNITTLFDRVKRFRYWRGGIKLRLQTNSTQFHYGSLFAAIVPYYTTSELVAGPLESSIWSLSGQQCSGYLSANTGKPLELSCSFQCPNEYLDITQQDDQRPFYLMVSVMNPLKVAGGASNPTLQLSVFAQFTDLELMGPSEITANSSSKKKVPADAEQSNANKQGTLGKVAGAVSNVASKLTTIPVIGGIASAVAPIASAVGSIFDYFGWDKPTNISSQSFTITRNSRGLQHGSGQDPSETVALKPDQKLSTEPKHFGATDEACRSFLKLIQTPMWNSSFTIANAQVTETVFKRLWVRPFAPDCTYSVPTETQRHDYLSYYSQFFKACRGGYRYFIHFDTSSYTTARIRVTFEPSNQTVATITDGGDSFSRIIDVNGATSVVLEVPYCYPSARMPVAFSLNADTAANGQLLFSLVNPIQTNGSSSDVIYVNIFRCAADDFRFYQPQAFNATKTYAVLAKKLSKASESRIVPNSLIQQLTAQTVTTLGDGPKILFDRVTEDEEIAHHNDFLHRYHYVQTMSGNVTSLMPTAGDPSRWIGTFRAYRGSVRLMAPLTIAPEGLYMGSSAYANLTSQGCYLGTGNDDVPIEIPYNNNVRFLPTMMSASNYLDAYDRSFYCSGTANAQCIWAAGDDFTLGLRRCPYPVQITIP